jgi:exonuclease SbcD
MLIENVTDLLRGFYDRLDRQLPAVVTAHMGVDTAKAGIEQELLIGYTLTFPADIFVDDRIDYVALGHIHKHQVVRAANPPIVYAGSLERVDFGEEHEDKGFIHVSLAKGETTHQFISIQPRAFITVEADVTDEEAPIEKLLSKIEKAIKPGCVMRLRYKVNQDQLPDIDEDLLRARCVQALSVRFQPEVVPNKNRARLPQLTESSVASPLVALETYLQEVAPDRKDRLLERARLMIADQCVHD